MSSRLPAMLPDSARHWHATLNLQFGRSGERTALCHNRHTGPLRVQKALYPEGETVCQAIILHPPSGIAAGDRLAIDATIGEHAHAQLTTPGASKWYRSAGLDAEQRIALTLDPGAVLEWLPQESIVFNGARARMETQISLASDSRYIGWEILCLGRRASGEKFSEGQLSVGIRVDRAGKPLWIERGQIAENDPLLTSPVGWAGHTVCGTLLCAVPDLRQMAADLLDTLRTSSPDDGAAHGITALPEILVARYLGDNSEAARHWFAELWRVLRPACCGRPAVLPRIWNT